MHAFEIIESQMRVMFSISSSNYKWKLILYNFLFAVIFDQYFFSLPRLQIICFIYYFTIWTCNFKILLPASFSIFSPSSHWCCFLFGSIASLMLKWQYLGSSGPLEGMMSSRYQWWQAEQWYIPDNKLSSSSSSGLLSPYKQYLEVNNYNSAGKG